MSKTVTYRGLKAFWVGISDEFKWIPVEIHWFWDKLWNTKCQDCRQIHIVKLTNEKNQYGIVRLSILVGHTLQDKQKNESETNSIKSMFKVKEKHRKSKGCKKKSRFFYLFWLSEFWRNFAWITKPNDWLKQFFLVFYLHNEETSLLSNSSAYTQ